MSEPSPLDVPRIATENADRPFLIVPDRGLTLSYGEFHAAALGLAARLRDAGIGRGDRVSAVLLNSPEFVVLYFAALHLGAVVAPANPALHPRDLGFVLDNAGAKLLIHSTETKRLLKTGVKLLELPRLGDPFYRAAENAPLGGATADDALTIVFTSGTTAAPKAVVQRIGSLLGNAAAFNAAMGLGPGDRLLHLMPMSYSGGFFNSLISPYMAGASVVLTPGWGARTALDFWKLPMAHGVNALWLSPTMAAALLAVDRDEAGKDYCRKHVAKIFVGTGPLPLKVKREFEAAYGRPLYESYGLSETLLLAANGPATGAVEGSVGRLLPGVSLSIRDAGEIFVKTPHLMAGYLDYATGKVKPVEGEWFATGDTGVLSDGALRLTGRVKDLIIRGGLNISPVALEEVLLRHEAVEQVAVVGAPNDLTGEDIVAVFRLKPGQNWPAVKPSLDAYCKANFIAADRPAALLHLEEFPAGLTGKVQKVKIREWAAQQLQPRMVKP
ncbi:MAG: acyl--CoA ligase [Elusimicrobia bacterium]|nr:acyl--CoA ligase [Elusimicrobiota bacterium]